MNWKSLEEKSYSPYSDQPKSCLVESKSGKFYAGVRIENIAYPLTIPAVQAACCICLSEGEVPLTIYVKDRNLEQLPFWVKEFGLNVELSENLPSVTWADLLCKDADNTATLPKLKKLLSKSVTPNSQFPVAAILFVEDGYFEGVNIEVSDWSKGLCAERVALAKSIAAGYTSYSHMEVHTKKGEFSSPCGACRQVIVEHLPYHSIKLHHADGSLSEHLTIDLLPLNFKSSTLKR